MKKYADIFSVREKFIDIQLKNCDIEQMILKKKNKTFMKKFHSESKRKN